MSPPLHAMGLQAYHSASFFAAIGTLLALLTRDRLGEGQWVDVSIQEAVAGAVEHVAPFYHQGLGIERSTRQPALESLFSRGSVSRRLCHALFVGRLDLAGRMGQG